ncbi:MAG: S9 family peptidase [Gemmatimonadales bacterium]|nr:MAG: S9 family peptidase [Gemmatimonadales bacterium]
MTFDASLVGGLRRSLFAGLTLALLLPFGLEAQSAALQTEGYLEPSPEILALVDAPRHENVLLTNLSPDGRYFLDSESEGLPPLELFARTYYRLGGVEIDPVANRSRNLTTRGSAGFRLMDAETGEARDIRVPDGHSVTGASWSPDGSRVAFLAHSDTETHLYVADVATGESRQLSTSPLLATRVTSAQWSGDGQNLFAVGLPADRDIEPMRPAVPRTPLIRITSEEENTLRTYASLLRDPHEEDLLEYYTTGQLMRFPADGGDPVAVGAPSMIESVDVSPDGMNVRVRTTERPFSYIVPASLFGDLDEIWDLSGEVLLEVERRELRDGSQNGNEDDDEEEPRRSISWHPGGEGITFLQRDPERSDDDDTGDEDARNDGPRMDRVLHWLPPYDEGTEVELFASEREIRSARFSPDADWLFVTERRQGTETLYAVELADTETRHEIYRWELDEFFENPGSLMGTSNDLGVSVVRLSSDGAHVYLSGTQYFENPDEDAPRPFVDRVVIRSGESERVFESDAEVFERITGVLDDDMNRLVLAREAPTMIPDSWLLDRSSGDLRQLTRNVDHHEPVTNAIRERIMVTRVDGVSFKVDVTLPADYQEGTRLPAIFWHYPREYSDVESYENTLRTYNKNSFPSVGARSMEILTVAGYAVIQPDHPTIGPSNRINDNYLIDLRANHLATIDALDARGWVDRQRLALGGHSYGGFGTINAMVHTPYFRAGIAGAPNSNRLLTPLGFQTERRNLWDARETYKNLSPFLWADQLNGALLIYHGEDDQNTGTFPDNSWRLIHALNGLGKTAALYMYPYEGHGQATRETLLDMWTRWVAWLDHYVKDADVNQPVAPITSVVDDSDAESEFRR